MSSIVEDDDTEDLEALRKAALATLKPKVQSIEQVISTGISRHQTPEWSEVPASVDYPGFADPVPEPSPFPVPRHGLAPQPHLRQPSPTPWRGHHFMNGIPDMRFKFQGFPGDRRPFLYHPRPSHRSFGDRGRPLNDRGRRPGRGYVTGRGGFSLTNVNSSIPSSQSPGLIQAPNIQIPAVAEPIPLGGNLIVIQPDSSTNTNDNLCQNSNGPPNTQPDVMASKTTTLSSTVAPETTSAPPPQKAKLLLPQDRYHSSEKTRKESTKSEPKQPEKKPKDKFSRYDKSDSEDEDDWTDNHSETDDIAHEIDKFLQDVDQDETSLRSNIDTEDKSEEQKPEEQKPEEPEAVEEISNLITEEEEQASHGSSPVASEVESLDLDALANGDPVIGDFDDLDFLVDKEPISDSVGDTGHTASQADHNSITDGAQHGEKTIDIETSPVSSSSSSPSSVSRSPKANQDMERKGLEKGGSNPKDITTNTSPIHHSKSSVDQLSHIKSSATTSKSSPREGTRGSRESRSPCPESRSLYRSRSPIQTGTTYSKRLSPRRSPLRNRESPYRRRSPLRRSQSPSRRIPRRSPTPKRISSPLRQNASPHRRPLYRRRSISPRERRRSPYGRSNSPYVRDRYRIDSRNQRDYEMSRRGGDNIRSGVRSPRRSRSPSSRSHEKGRWPDPISKNRSSPNRLDRKAQQTQLRDTSQTGSMGNNYNGREDPSKGVFMDEKELEKLSPEERAKIEARRTKFAAKGEVKLEDAKKTVSLKSIKERKKKTKKNEKIKEDPLDVGLGETVSKKNDKSGISLKALRKKMEIKKTNQDSSDEDDVPSSSLHDIEDDSEHSDSGRAWKQEGNTAKSVRGIKPRSNTINPRFDIRERPRSRSHRDQDLQRAHRSPVTKAKPLTTRFSSAFKKNEEIEMSDEDDYIENIPSSRVGSSVVAASRFHLDVPPEKLRIQIQVPQKEKKLKKSKTKPDFSNVYSVPAKRSRSSKSDDDEEEDDEDMEKTVPKKKLKKKEKKVKKKKSSKDNIEENLVAAVSADPVPTPSRPSILERLGKKVGLDVVEKKKKKKKSKQSHMDSEERDDLDQHIEKMKLKNAAIERRQREIQLDKERYG